MIVPDPNRRTWLGAILAACLSAPLWVAIVAIVLRAGRAG